MSKLRLVAFGVPVFAILANCGGTGGGVPGLGNVGALTGECPDTNSAEAIADFDWASKFKLEAKASAKLKAGLGAIALTNQMAAEIDGELKVACTGLANDLGVSGKFDNAQAACGAAQKAMADARAKLGAVRITLQVTEPHCSVKASVMADCSGKCDATIKPGSAELKCEGGKLQGECSGKCEGSCEASGAMACSGECSGKCDAEIKGTCGGTCNGKCDGAPSSASCAGVCEGKCDAEIKGTCKGKCGGKCEMSASAQCSGTCTGKCDVEMKAPRCTGKVTPPEMTAECKAKCNAEVDAKAECTPPHIALGISGGDAKLVAGYRVAIEKNLPVIIKVAFGTGKRAIAMAGDVEQMAGGLEASLKASADTASFARLAACIAAPIKKTADAAASLKASAKVSVNVQASASASGSAGGGAATKK